MNKLSLDEVNNIIVKIIKSLYNECEYDVLFEGIDEILDEKEILYLKELLK